MLKHISKTLWFLFHMLNVLLFLNYTPICRKSVYTVFVCSSIKSEFSWRVGTQRSIGWERRRNSRNLCVDFSEINMLYSGEEKKFWFSTYNISYIRINVYLQGNKFHFKLRKMFVFWTGSITTWLITFCIWTENKKPSVSQWHILASRKRPIWLKCATHNPEWQHLLSLPQLHVLNRLVKEKRGKTLLLFWDWSEKGQKYFFLHFALPMV